MKFRQIFFLITLLTALSASATNDSAATLDGVAAKLRNAPSMTASFTVTEPSTGTETFSATIAGNKFVIGSSAMKTWFDGTTQWTYIASDNEVTIDEPTDAELTQINPLLILNNFRQNFSSKTESTTASAIKISLTAKTKTGDISSAIVTINPKNQLPQEIVVKFRSGKTATIRISSLTIGKALPITTFRFQKTAYPKAEINDLR